MKEDWWWKESGQTYGPRPELRKEVLEKAGTSYYQYTADRFMKFAQEQDLVAANTEAVDEVRRIREMHTIEEERASLQSIEKQDWLLNNLSQNIDVRNGLRNIDPLPKHLIDNFEIVKSMLSRPALLDAYMTAKDRTEDAMKTMIDEIERDGRKSVEKINEALHNATLSAQEMARTSKIIIDQAISDVQGDKHP